MRPVKTDRNDAAGLAQIMRTGWFKEVRIKSRSSYQVRSLLVAREMLVRIRVKIENEIRGLLRTLVFCSASASEGSPDEPTRSSPANSTHQRRCVSLPRH